MHRNAQNTVEISRNAGFTIHPEKSQLELSEELFI